MGKRTRFVLITVWIVCSRAYDAYCTYQLTPDLTHEANPLVTVVGVSSWSVLLFIIGLLTAYVIYAYYRHVFHPIDILPKEEGFTLSNMIAFTYLSRKDNWYAVFYKLPSTFSWFTNYMGAVMTKGLIYAGMVSTIMWLLIRHTEFYPPLHSPALIYSILITGCIVIIYRWNCKMHLAYLSKFN